MLENVDSLTQFIQFAFAVAGIVIISAGLMGFIIKKFIGFMKGVF